jgi:dTDP-4-dehydrorhamnose reductase
MIFLMAFPKQLIGIVRTQLLLDKQTVLVTGANGQVGSNICRVFKSSFNVIGFSSRELDVCDASAINKIFDAVRPDIVVNAAAYTKVDDAEINIDLADLTNVNAAKHLCNACLDHKCLLVHFSTDYVFDGTETSRNSEEDQTNPLNTYGRSKLAGDCHIIENADRYLIFRLAWVYDHAGTNFPKKILQAAAVKDHLTVVDDQIGTPTSGDFIAKIVHQLIVTADVGDNQRFNNLYNLVPNGEASRFEFAVSVLSRAEAMGFDLKCRAKDVIPVKSSHLVQPAKRPSRVVLDNRKIQRELGISFAPWDSCIDGFLEQMRRHNDRV